MVILRDCTASQNLHNYGKTRRNTSGFKGVSYEKRERKWQATIRVRGRRFNLRRFNSPEEAAQAYAEAATQKVGDFIHASVEDAAFCPPLADLHDGGRP